MALLRFNEIAKMSEKDRSTKLSELKLELIKSQVNATKSGAKTKEIKRAISRLLTFNNSSKGVLKSK